MTLKHLVIWAAIPLLTLGCGAEDSKDTTDALQALSVEISGSPCFEDQCTTRLGVEAPGQLVLRDNQGELRFEVDAAEVEAIMRLAQGVPLTESAEEAQCLSAMDASLTIEIQSATKAGAIQCGRLAPGAREEIVHRIEALRNATLPCPEWSEPSGPMATIALPQRALCWFCYGDCQPE